ncbi:uncharacterized protein LY89DRAFT_184221 [Mollisia scopiformis]|uniref:Uncharacterized protein n=1 Tax=Mollisia scopiformis TaxID=149040 RepID=A0A194XT67_MOLSC|nr:uncharacterized protein LY89DRAFT_184221 [Mollisia scopiformis]KUJ23505.1 hypothetical protein LY89DRAFT_184221 [Mollisia scopiformis]
MSEPSSENQRKKSKDRSEIQKSNSPAIETAYEPYKTPLHRHPLQNIHTHQSHPIHHHLKSLTQPTGTPIPPPSLPPILTPQIPTQHPGIWKPPPPRSPSLPAAVIAVTLRYAPSPLPCPAMPQRRRRHNRDANRERLRGGHRWYYFFLAPQEFGSASNFLMGYLPTLWVSFRGGFGELPGRGRDRQGARGFGLGFGTDRWMEGWHGKDRRLFALYVGNGKGDEIYGFFLSFRSFEGRSLTGTRTRTGIGICGCVADRWRMGRDTRLETIWWCLF